MQRRQRVVLPLLLLVLTLAIAPAAQAGWNGLGGQLNADDRDSLGATSQLTAVAGVPWLIWTERPANTFTFQVRAAQWTGSAWSPTGPLNLDPDHDATHPSLTDVGGVPWATWTEVTQNTNGGQRHVHVARWNGNAWVAVGGVPDADQGAAAVVRSVGGVAHVAFTDSDGSVSPAPLRVVRWTGTAWADVGSGPVTTTASFNDFTLADVGGVPHVAWRSGGELYVARTVGGVWTQLGDSLRHTGTNSASQPSLTEVDGAPAVAWNEEVGSVGAKNLRVARWSGSTWVDLGGVLGTAAYPDHAAPSLAVVGGAPWVAWAPDRVATVSSFDGQAWTQVGAPVVRVAGDWSGDPTLVEIGGVPHVGYAERFVTSSGGDNQDFHYEVLADRLLDDADTAHVSFTSATASASEAAGGVTLTVRRTGGTGGPATVHYATADGTADASDYTPASGTITFAAGETEKPIDVAFTTDEAVEGPETFAVTLSDPGGDTRLDAPSTATVTVTDDDLVDTKITFGPDGFLTDRGFRFFLFEATPSAGATFACLLDGAAAASCTSPFDPGADIAEGPHTLSVRATSAAQDVDPTPATRAFFVDTVRPVTSAAPYGAQLLSGRWSGPVQVRALATDAEPGSGVGEVRCSVDPAGQPPQTASDLPRTACPVTVSDAGTHVVYVAAVDKAGNAGIPARVAFTIIPPPETTITDGPTGTVWVGSSEVTFTSDVGGATFSCQLDGGTAAPCASPFTAAGLTSGDHTLSVAAVSPDGVRDPTPAIRAWTIGSKTTMRADCEIKPFLELRRPPYPGSSPHKTSCLAAPTRSTCPSDWTCVPIPACPLGAKCTITTTSQWYDADRNAPWGIEAWVLNDASVYFINSCSPGVDGDRCRVTATGSAINDDGFADLEGLCSAGADGGTFENEYVRRLECGFEVTIEPVGALAAVTSPSGRGVTVVAPGPGTVTLAPAASGRPARAAAAKPAFKAASRAVRAAGPVTITPKLVGAAARTFRRKHEIRLTFSVKFAPRGGGRASLARRSVVLRAVMPPPKRCAKKATTCQKRRKLAKLGH